MNMLSLSSLEVHVQVQATNAITFTARVEIFRIEASDIGEMYTHAWLGTVGSLYDGHIRAY